ncbi:MAG: adenosylcobinamide-GDP ribazoletransferase [Bianqueaceae bacterium]
MKSLVLTLQFLTRLPCRVIEGDDAIFARGVVCRRRYNRIVQLFVFYLANLVFSPITAGFLTVLMDTFMTGGLHLDGLSDTWDGVFSVRDRERMLEIMKDSRIGSFGVLGMLMVLGCKWVMYTELAGGLSLYGNGMDLWCRVLGPVVAAPIVGRIVMALLIYISEYARKTGMGIVFAHKDAMNLPVTPRHTCVDRLIGYRHGS